MMEKGMSQEETMNHAMNVIGREPVYDSSLSCFSR